MEKILVTGGLGQIGSYIVDTLLKELQNCNIVIIDNLSNSKIKIKKNNVTTLEFDINDRIRLTETFKEFEFDTIFHCAAQISVNKSINNPINDALINIMGTLSLLQLSIKNNTKNFVTMGSAAVIGTPKELPITADHHRNPISPYGISKLSAELYTQVFSELHKLNFKVLRPFNVYSPRILQNDPYSGVIPKFLECVKNNRPFTIEGDGTQTRDFIFAKDVAKLAIRSVNYQGQNLFNAATGQATSILDLSKIISEVTNSPWEVNFTDEREGDIKHSYGTKSVLFDFKPTSLREGIGMML